MSDRAIKNTFIKFGLVSIPVKLTSLRTQNITFNLVCGYCNGKVRYKRYCENCGRELKYNELKKGFKISKSNFVILEKEQLELLKKVEDNGIEIIGFTKAEEIPFYLYENTYNLLPQKDTKGFTLGLEAFALFREALKISGLCAIGKMVMRNKSYLVAIRTYQDRLFLSTLTYPHRISLVDKVKGEVKEEELNLALELIKKMTYYTWSEFYNEENAKDEYLEKLTKIISGKLKGVEIETQIEKAKNLMESLKKSVEMVK